jgi:hypothetical protein
VILIRGFLHVTAVRLGALGALTYRVSGDHYRTYKDDFLIQSFDVGHFCLIATPFSARPTETIRLYQLVAAVIDLRRLIP